jgi:peptidoglycan hydrolase-like protein with peptidoglycan-binding domain
MAGKLVALCAASLAVLALAANARASNPQIAGLQVALRAYGLYRGPIDSIAGPQTVRATKAFQRRAGVQVDGLAGARTREALGPLGEPLFGRRMLRRRMFGWDVSVLQFLLTRHGALLRVDGYFGAATNRALRGYQRQHRLEVDGIAGPFTLRALAGGRPELSPG